MSEKLRHSAESSSESQREELKSQLERAATSPEKAQTSAEQREHQDRKVEAARERLKDSPEKSDRDETEKPQETRKSPEKKPKFTKAERTAAYRATMKQTRQQLSPSARTFSKLIHARPVEVASEFLEETIYRPSFLICGGVGALIAGTTVYLVARKIGFSLSGSEFTLSLLVGGAIGWILEKLWHRFRR